MPACDGHADGRTDRHTTTAYTALAQRRAVKTRRRRRWSSLLTTPIRQSTSCGCLGLLQVVYSCLVHAKNTAYAIKTHSLYGGPKSEATNSWP